MSTTALKIITKSMRKCGILTMNELPTADEANDALDALNDMLSSASNDSMMCYARVWEIFNLTGGQISYTIGTGQNFNTARPIFIAEAYIRNGTTDLPLEIISDEVYNSSTIYKAASGIPQWMNYDNGYPTATIRLYPAPSGGLQLFLLSEKLLSQFALIDVVDLPPGWEEYLVFNLPERLAGDYGQEVPAAVQTMAIKSKASIQKAIMKQRNFDSNPGMVTANSIYTGWNR